ncbi:MAG: glycosyltransferase [Candidatus Omnitrophica bacterium]|nr:glycosyltransferase [Candidatus Omnitrophota bacterium]
MKVLFVPDYRGSNLYQSLLANELRSESVVVGFSHDIPIKHLLLNRNGTHVLHIHWIKPLLSSKVNNIFFKSFKLLQSTIKLYLLRIIGIRIIWTVHNLREHDTKNPFMNDIINIVLVSLSHAIIVHSKTGKTIVENKYFKGKIEDKVVVVPHGHYIGAYKNNVTKDESREMLGLPKSKFIYLFFGAVRPYKGLDVLIKAFELIKNDDIALVIAGKPLNDSFMEKVLSLSKLNSIYYFLKYIDNDEIQYYMNASDAVVCSYNGIFTSGSVILAMSYGRPVIAPNLGCIRDYLHEDGGILYEHDDIGSLCKALLQLYQNTSDNLGQNNLRRIAINSWKRIALKTIEVYRND